MLSFQKSLIVEQFQGNYLNINNLILSLSKQKICACYKLGCVWEIRRALKKLEATVHTPVFLVLSKLLALRIVPTIVIAHTFSAS